MAAVVGTSEMPVILRVVGALVITYVLSRLLIRLTDGRASVIRLLIAHLLSIAIITVTLGFLRAYWTEFDPFAALIYVAPQLLWLVIDLARRA